MKKQQSGFTLIELIMVIVVLGILAAFALPRFADFGGQARTATIEGIAGAMRSAAGIARATQAAAGGSGADPVTLEGQSISMIGGYPTAAAAGIVRAAQLSGVVYSADATNSAGVMYVALAGDTADATNTCVVKYTAANTTAGSEAPAKVETTLTGCN